MPQRLALLLFGVALGLGIAEASLQVLRAGNLVRTQAERRDLVGRRVAYAIGDSHTWGWKVNTQTEAMPVRLEARLNHDHADGPFVVENLGFPGFNTSQALDRLRVACAEHRPDLVLVLAGFNDAWNPQESEGPASPWVLLRLLRLALLDRRDSQGDPTAIDPTFDPTKVELIDGVPHYRDSHGRLQPVGGRGASEGLHAGDELQRKVEQGLRRITDFCSSQGIPVILQTYASAGSPAFVAASRAARAVAKEQQIPLVDHHIWLERQGGDFAVFLQPDGHPTARGCDAMAAALADTLRDDASTRAWSNWEPASSDAPDAEASIELSPPRRHGNGDWRFALQGEPGAPWQLSLSKARHDDSQGPHPLHPDLGLAVDELLLASRNWTFDIQGRFDATGEATATVHAPLMKDYGDGPFFAQAVLLRRYLSGDSAKDLRAFSSVVEMRR